MSFQLLPFDKHEVYPFIDPRQNLKDAAVGKTVLITGAGEGIGLGIAEAFALAGAECLILAARRQQPLEEAKAAIQELMNSEGNENATQVVAKGGVDISSESSVEALFASLENEGVAIPDVLVQNAGISKQTEPVVEANTARWCMIIDTNAKGTFLICQAYLKALERAGKRTARIINLSSNASWRWVNGRSSYAVSKVAINTLSEYIDNEGTQDGRDIRCVALHPGGVLTSNADTVPETIRRILIDPKELPGCTAVYLSTSRAEFLMGRFVSATWDMEGLEKLKDRIVREDLMRTKVVGIDWINYESSSKPE